MDNFLVGDQRSAGKLETRILTHPIETEKSDSTTPASDAPAEIVLVVDDRGYARMMSGSFVVPRSYYFGLVTIQEPFDPQWDLGWGLI